MIQRGWRMTLPDALHPDIQEEAFSDGVVPAVTFAAHAADKAVAGQQALVKRAGILPPCPNARSIRAPGPRCALKNSANRHGHLETEVS